VTDVQDSALTDGPDRGDAARQGAKEQDARATVIAGQLPSAETIQAYESAYPGSAERILHMVEEQSTRRLDMEETLVKAAAHSERLGQLLGLLLVAAVFAVGTWLIIIGHEIPGTLLAVTDLGLMVAVFLGRDRPAS